MKSYHIEFTTGLTCMVDADNIYSALVLAAERNNLTTEDIASVTLDRGGD